VRTEELDFPLPEELIALHPAPGRAAARLLAVDLPEGAVRHLGFRDFPDLLRAGDLVVRNDTRVVPARLEARKESGGRVEGLWLGAGEDGVGCFMLSGGRLRPGTVLFTTNGGHRLRLAEKLAPGRWRVVDESGRGWLRLLAEVGATPLPPYIRRRRAARGEPLDGPEDRDRYQTVWAASDGAVAAPTASLHFDRPLLAEIERRGVRLATLTLHVGAGTFLPIRVEELASHPMHAESFTIPGATLAAVEETRRAGGRVIALGTTVCRALESWALDGRREAITRLFITPGFPFRVTDALLTNFHTPRSTLLALVAAFAAHHGSADGLQTVKDIYATAVAHRYRFYSYGDATFWSRP